MGYDLSSVLAAAENVVSSSSGSSSNGPRVLYPSEGTLQVRILFNPKSNSVSRSLYTHKINNKRITCAKQYKESCPVCNALDTIQQETGKDLWQLKSNHREIIWAQYVNCSSDYDWGDTSKYKAPNAGDLVLLMLPWSAYSQIMEIIQKAGSQAEQLLTLNEGRIFAISRKTDNTGVKYRAEIDAFAGVFKSANSQSEFESWLNEVPSLMKQRVPEVPEKNFLVKLQVEADDLKGKMLGIQQVPAQQPAIPQVAQPVPEPVQSVEIPVVQSATTPAIVPENPNMEASPVSPTPAATTAAASGKPECFGQCSIMSEKCLMCDYTIDCDAVTPKN